MTIDPAKYPRVGLKSFPDTLPLGDHEVVLTFDDGPFPRTTGKVLASLAEQCVRATFFQIGKNAEANAWLVKKIADDGHTIGNHTWSHPSLLRIKPDLAVTEIDRGMAADQAALKGSQATAAAFFRFPGFESTPELLSLLQSRGVAVFGADLWASDWNEMTPAAELKLITERLEQARKGIILFHDTKARTAAIMPEFLRYLRDHRYRVVHIIPATVEKIGR